MHAPDTDTAGVNMASNKSVNISKDAKECYPVIQISVAETEGSVRGLACVYFESYHQAIKKKRTF